MSKINISAINVLNELERLGWDSVPGTNNEIKVKCAHPDHTDNSPSASINLDSKKFQCFGCGAKGDFVEFLAYASNVERGTVLYELGTRYPNLGGQKTYNKESAEKHHIALWQTPHMLAELHKRGVTDEFIRKERIGFSNGRITIPVHNLTRDIIGMRLYLPGAPGHNKMLNSKGFSTPEIYLPDQLDKYDSVWYCGGEMKAAAASTLLNKINVGAFTITSGEGKGFRKEHIRLIKGKEVFVCMDIDHAGRRAAERLSKLLLPHAASVHIIDIPLNPEEYPTGDINDYIYREKATPEMMAQLMTNAVRYTGDIAQVDEEEDPIEVALAESTKPEYYQKKLRTEGILSALGENQYFVPSEIAVLCDKQQPNCGNCPVYSLNEDKGSSGISLKLNTCNPYYLAMINARDGIRDLLIADAVGIPKCKSANITVKKRVKLVEVRLSPKLKIGEETKTAGNMRAYIVEPEIPELGNIYNFTGSVFSSPKDQSVSLMFNDSELSDTSLNSYDPNEDELDKLRVFQPESWTEEALSKKLEEIYLDFASNVTHIHNRLDLHLAVDLTYHSCLFFELKKGAKEIGWINALVVGDSSQGKTATVTALKNHYGLGEKVDCKNATTAGLIGGLQQIQKSWFITWGIIPSNDRGLVVLEEFKGLPISTISKMTDMRSSGIVEIPKIEKDKAYARTRLLALSNARDNKQMSEFGYGIRAIENLVGNPEDIRRFDFALIVAKEEVNSNIVGSSFLKEDKFPHKYTSAKCRELILFAWTRSRKQIKFQKESLTAINDAAEKLEKKYHSKFPLLDTGTTRKKIARISTALAIRTFSVTKNLDTVLVRPCHVSYIVKFLDRIYSNQYFGYDKFSRDYWRANTITDPKQVRFVIGQANDPKHVVEALNMTERVMANDIADLFGVNRDASQRILSKLVMLNCLKREPGSIEYSKTTQFTEMLRGEGKWERLKEKEDVF